MGAGAHPTELYKRGPAVTEANWHDLITRLPGGRLIVSGGLPRGLSPDVCRTLLLELSREPERKPVMNSSGAALRAALEAGVALVKPNRQELAELVPVRGDGIAEAKLLFKSYGVPILLSLGAAGAALIAGETVRTPALEIEVLNPFASGDYLLAAFVWARRRVESPAPCV